MHPRLRSGLQLTLLGSALLLPLLGCSRDTRPEATTATADTPAAPPPIDTAATGKIPAALAGKLVTLQDGALRPAPADRLSGVRHLAFYYSAQWCPPCRAFTPDLVAAYQTLKAQHPDFEVIFVSSDRSADAMRTYMRDYKMSWPALAFDARQTTPAIERPDHENGIPNLVFLDADGREISTSFTRDGDYRGPQAVLADIRRHYGL